LDTIETLKKILKITLFILLLSPAATYLVFQIPSVQTTAARRAAAAISKGNEAEIEIGEVYFVFFNKLIIKNITITGPQSDTLLHAGKISLSVKPLQLINNKIRVSRLELSDGFFNLVHDSDSTTNLSLLSGKTEQNTDNNTSLQLPDIKIQSLATQNFGFRMHNPFNDNNNAQITDYKSIDFNNLSIERLYIDISNLSAKDSLITATIKNMSFVERSDFHLQELSSEFSFRPGYIQLNDLTIEDNYSKIASPSLSLKYNKPGAFSNFTEDVTIDADFDNSLIHLSTIAKFAPSLKDNRLALYIEGKIEGPVSYLKTKSLSVYSESLLSYINLDASISGLPNTRETMVFVDINDSKTTTGDISRILSSVNTTKSPTDFSNISPLINYSFEGRVAGLLTDFVANGTISSSIGNVYMDAILRQESNNEGFTINGEISTDNLDIGIITNNSTLGQMTMDSRLKAYLRDETTGGNEFYIENLDIDKLHFNGYDYSSITATGSYLNDTFDGKVICRDPNLNLLFQGLIGISGDSESYYDFYADIIYADIAKLNFDKRYTTSVLSLKTLANFVQKPSGDMEGNISVREFNFTNNDGTFPIGDISVQSISQKDNFTVYLRSSFANATFRGSDFITNFIDKHLDLTLKSNLNALFPRDKSYLKNLSSSYELEIDFLDVTAISRFLLPGFHISEGSRLTSEIDDMGRVNTTLISPDLSFKNSTSRNLLLEINSDTTLTEINIRSDFIRSSGITIDNTNLNVNISDNLINLNTDYTNKGERANRLDFMSDILFTALPEENSVITDITIYPSELYLNGENWKFSGSKIVNQDSTYVFHNFGLYSGGQELSIDGIISSNPYDTLSVKLNELEITPFSNLLGEKLNITGHLTGEAYVSDLLQEPKVFTSITGNEITIAGHELGRLDVTTEWDNIKKDFLLSIENTLRERTPLNLNGTYTPNENKLYLTADLDNMSVSYFEPFLKDIVSRTGGGLSGSLILEGTPDKLSVSSSDTRVKDLSFTVDFTQSHYTLNGPVVLSREFINLNDISIEDNYGNKGTIHGGISHDYFSDMILNTNVQFNNLEVLNTTEADNSDFYGKAFATGRLSIRGPFDKILMDITAATNANTSIHIPLSSATDVGDNNILTFIDPREERKTENNNGSINGKSSEFAVNLRANITPEAAMFIEIDKSVGDIITSYGSGLVTLEINPSRDIFSIQGDYQISRGSYKFVLQGFIERDFSIMEGGNIGFNGDVMKTNLNLTANYRTKAAINTLISDTSSVSTRRTVDCKINMTGQLMNPRLGFDIDIPDIDPVTKARVNAALNTEDKVVRQVMSLLVSGSFIPDVQSSIVNNSTILYSNATEVLSNQINKIFNQLEIPLDLSFNYQPGQNGRDLFDAAISAQLFNNRVIVNGNIGSSRYINNNSGDVVGDLEVEIKLDDKGRFRAKAFSHSADQYSNYLDNSQRNGVGLVYQEEFSSFKELINKLFRRKKRKKGSIDSDQDSTE
jgi:hypothetical protein